LKHFYKIKKKWGLGIGDWGLGIAQSPIPNPQSPSPFNFKFIDLLLQSFKKLKIYFKNIQTIFIYLILIC
jgi:hypothetical protein